MARKLHPALVRDAEIIRNAARFDISLFLGTGRFANSSATTLAEACDQAARLLAANPTSRRPLIYAVDARGRAAPVNSSFKPQKEYLA
jgi:hypothetical protein